MAALLTKIIQAAHERNIILTPCSNDELADVEKRFGANLPLAYNEFLSTMGRGTNPGFLRGHSCFINELFDLRDGAIELLKENDFESDLTENDFVFWMSQGYQFAFFKLSEGDDPPVYYYRENSNQKGFVKIKNTFSEFLMAILMKDQNLFNMNG